MEYSTIQGDTWDIIAKKIYNDEKYAGYLMSNNLKLLDIFIFKSGVIVNAPELIDEVTTDMPDWRI